MSASRPDHKLLSPHESSIVLIPHRLTVRINSAASSNSKPCKQNKERKP